MDVEFKLPNYSTKIGALRKAKTINAIDALNSLFSRTYTLPVTGSIVAMPDAKDKTIGFALGIVSYRHGVFVGKDGLEFQRLEGDEIFWSLPTNTDNFIDTKELTQGN